MFVSEANCPVNGLKIFCCSNWTYWVYIEYLSIVVLYPYQPSDRGWLKNREPTKAVRVHHRVGPFPGVCIHTGNQPSAGVPQYLWKMIVKLSCMDDWERWCIYMQCWQVEWPVNLIITDECLQLYSRIFSFMLQLKRCVWVLKELFHRLKQGQLFFLLHIFELLVHDLYSQSVFLNFSNNASSVKSFVRLVRKCINYSITQPIKRTLLMFRPSIWGANLHCLLVSDVRNWKSVLMKTSYKVEPYGQIALVTKQRNFIIIMFV